MYGNNYMIFESEFDRLKPMFLLEAEDDDLSEAEPEKEEPSKGDAKGKKSEDKDKDKSGDSDGKDDNDDSGHDGDDGDTQGASGDASGDDIDLDGDSDLSDITGGNADSPSPDQVNADNAKPGAIDPANLLKEMSSGTDNIYTRVIGYARQKYPNGQCQVKDLLEPIAHAVKAYMRNKNYAPIPKDAMKAICLNVARNIYEGKTPTSGKARTESAHVTYRDPRPVESRGLMEGWKEILLAGGLAANGAMGATAQSAPVSTLQGTPRYQAMQQQANAVKQATPEKQKSFGGKAIGRAASGSGTQFSPDSTYQLSPQEFMKYQSSGKLPKHYIVASDGEAGKNMAKSRPGGAPAGKSKGYGKDAGNGNPKTAQGGSTTQAAVKEQAKSGKTTRQISTGKDDRCCCDGDGIDVGKTMHELGHKGVDMAYKGGSAIWGGLKGAAKGLWDGVQKSWNSADKELENDHGQMIKKKNKSKK